MASDPQTADGQQSNSSKTQKPGVEGPADSYAGDRLPRVVARLVGSNFEGPLSDWDEWHAVEYGLYLGFSAALSGKKLDVSASLAGFATAKRVLEGSMMKQVRHEKHYFGLAFVGGYLVGRVAFSCSLGTLPPVSQFV